MGAGFVTTWSEFDGSTLQRCNLFNLVTFLTPLTFKHVHYCHRLSRCGFVLVLLVGTDMGRFEKAIRRPRSISVEDRVDGFQWFANLTRAGAMVLSTQRNNDAFAVHA